MKKVPEFSSDAEAEAFLQQDLSDLDFSAFRQVRFDFEPKASQLNMRVPASLLAAIKARAAERGMPYTRYIRELMQEAVRNPPASPNASEA